MADKCRLAFCLFDYFPHGGLQRDFLSIAQECAMRCGHVDVYTGSWTGEQPDNINVKIFPVRGITNHGRSEYFSRQFNKHVKSGMYNAVVGFNKMPGLDVYFAADTCFAAKAEKKSFFHRISPRYKTYMRLERAVFDKKSKTEILLISEREKPFYSNFYGTPDSRFHLLPPGIDTNLTARVNKKKIRFAICSELFENNKFGNNKIDMKDPDCMLILMVGSGFKTKGVDRSIKSVSALPDKIRKKTVLLIVGRDNKKPFLKLARRLKVSDRVFFIGTRDDVPNFFISSDLLLHPARVETAGKVLLEAMACGLPVLVTDVCGYSSHVKNADAGELLSSPFNQKALNKLLLSMLTSHKKEYWGKKGSEYVLKNDMSGMTQKAVDFIMKIAK